MRSPVRHLAAGLALTGLWAGTVAHATDVARLPLKASVLAKPNVVFAMDDSGSMDWEVLLDTASGLFWWNGTTGWDSARGKPQTDNGTDANRRSYLFPVGNATGGQLYGWSSVNGLALAPTPQFAWMRSSAFNPIYYDSLTTYKPWAPAYHDGALRTYADADPSRALSHPAYPAGPSLRLNADWNAGNANFTNRDGAYTFYFQAGMLVPADAVRVSGTCTPGAVVTAGNTCFAGVPYYPATFWHAEACTPGPDCVTAPDGVTRLKRYEIRSTTASYPSGRSYAAEMQNFANWFTYYRKRKLMLAASMGDVLENLTGLRMGVVPFNDHTTVTMRDADNPAASVNGREVAGRFYKNAMAAQGTPTHATVKHIGSQYAGNTSIVQYACQRNSMFVVTDGFSNTTSISVPPYPAATYGGVPPYSTTPAGSLADLALSYYTNRLRPDLPAGRLPPSSSTAPNADRNTNLHINTYAISLGVRGSLWPSATDPFVSPPAWTAPVADTPSMIDDQWHATINGRGLMYLADKPEETSAGIRAVLNDIISQTGAQGGVAVSTVNLVRGDSRAYFGTYNPAGWIGDVTAQPIDAATGRVDADPDVRIWSAGDQLLARDWTTRVIASAGAGGGLPFTAAAVGAAVNPGDAYGATADLVDYLRGNRALEGTAFRRRSGLIGAVINSEPAVDRDNKVVYVQSGEGMLHAFDTDPATGGRELWAFVPRSVLGGLGPTAQRGYVFETQLDGSATLGKAGAKTLLVAGTGAAGRSFHALDVSSPRGLSEAGLASKYLWEFPRAGDAATRAKVGLALGRARIVETAADGHVVLVTSGYASDDGRGRLWMLDAVTGAVVHEFDTGVGTAGADAGLAQISAFREDDGTVRYAYGGDLRGNVWRFDLKDKTAPLRLTTLTDGSGVAQPVTAPPELSLIGGKRVVIVGTGRLLDIGDFGSPRVQSMYAIADGATIASPRSALVRQTYTRATDTISTNPVDWGSDRGWFLDLPAGEQANTQPTIAFGAVAFTTNTAGGSDCTASSRLYVLDVTSGSRFPGADFVSDEISPSATSSGVTALATAGQRIVGSGQDADGKPWERDIVSSSLIDPAKNAWREVRRR